jgi:D-lactate dehydrogenase
VTIYFVNIEPVDEAYFANALADQPLISVKKLSEVGEDAEIACIFIEDTVDDAFLAAHPRLRLIATRSASIDHIDVEACGKRRVKIANVPFYGEESVAEHTFALRLALARRLRGLMGAPAGGSFSYEATRGFELKGKTLGIIGVGRIGQRVAKLAGAFEMKVVCHDVSRPSGLAEEMGFSWASLDELLAQSDIITLHASLTEATYHILDHARLAKTNRGVLVINTARGSLIETAALRDALESGQVGGAGLDVLQDERLLRQHASDIIASDILRHLRSDALAQEARDADRLRELQELMLGDALLAKPNGVFTPHIAFNTTEAVARLMKTTAENILSFIEGNPQNLLKES